jgi:hypothetical protein
VTYDFRDAVDCVRAMLWDLRGMEFLEEYSGINKCWAGKLTLSQVLWSILTLAYIRSVSIKPSIVNTKGNFNETLRLQVIQATSILYVTNPPSKALSRLKCCT